MAPPRLRFAKARLRFLAPADRRIWLRAKRWKRGERLPIPSFKLSPGFLRTNGIAGTSDRDRNFQQVTSGRNANPNVSPDIYGTESLDPYGQWQTDPQYGNVWVPSVGPDWAPYQAGRWAYIDYYGWTWVSADPWGWAPYHYGRWFRGAYGWGMVAGSVRDRSRLLEPGAGRLLWLGRGIGVGFGFGFGNVGWVPLAPFEVYRPWYGRGFAGGIVNVNVVNTFRNARFAGAISSVRAAEFGRGSLIAGNMVRPTSADLARGGMVNGAMPFWHSAASSRFSDAAVNSHGMPQATAIVNSIAGMGTTTCFQDQRGREMHGGWRRLNGNSSGGNAGGPQSQARGGSPQLRGGEPQSRGPAAGSGTPGCGFSPQKTAVSHDAAESGAHQPSDRAESGIVRRATLAAIRSRAEETSVEGTERQRRRWACGGHARMILTDGG